jgi:hypothetical protein
MAPPLNISYQELDIAAKVIREAIEQAVEAAPELI